MNSLRTLKMKKVPKLFFSEKEVRKARTELEKKTKEAFKAFARSKRSVREEAHMKFLD